MRNYYDELEVSQTASKEAIEKVYKVLAKKYHPDTTQETNKIMAEEKFKRISEAYEILSNDDKRKKYDLELKQTNPTIPYEEYIQVVKQRDYLANYIHELEKIYSNSNNINNSYKNNNYYNPNTYTSNINNTNYSNKTYYENTQKSTYTFSYYINRLKEFFINIGLLFLSIIVALLIINFFI